MPLANGVIDTVVAAGLTREYVENPFEFMGNVRAETNPVTGRIESLLNSDGTPSRVGQKRRQNGPVVLGTMNPRSVSTAFTGTASLMLSAPGPFYAVAAIAINYDTAATFTIDKLAFAVSERSDTSVVNPVIGGTTYNALAGATDQLGFVPGTWAGAASVTVAVATAAASGSGEVIPTFAMSDFVPLESIERVDDPAKFPLVICREYFNARTVSYMAYGSAQDVTDMATAMSPYEMYNYAQVTVDGCGTPSTFNAPSQSQSGRIVALAFKMKGASDFILWTGDSIDQGCFADGTSSATKPTNNWSGYVGLTGRGLASLTRPVGHFSLAYTGITSADYLEKIKRAIATMKPSIAVYPVCTANDSPNNTAKMSLEMARALDFIDYCEQNSVMPVLRVPVPYSGFTEASRIAFIAKIKALRNVVVMDANAPVYDATNAAQNYWTAAAYQDGVHPNTAGHVAIANNASIPLFKMLLGQNS